MQHQVSDEKVPYGNRGQIMIIDYDKNPMLNTDQKIQSLIQSMQRALDEMKKEITKLEKKVESLEEGAE